MMWHKKDRLSNNDIPSPLLEIPEWNIQYNYSDPSLSGRGACQNRIPKFCREQNCAYDIPDHLLTKTSSKPEKEHLKSECATFFHSFGFQYRHVLIRPTKTQRGNDEIDRNNRF